VLFEKPKHTGRSTIWVIGLPKRAVPHPTELVKKQNWYCRSHWI
jgi:hypothetical protein